MLILCPMNLPHTDRYNGARIHEQFFYISLTRHRQGIADFEQKERTVERKRRQRRSSGAPPDETVYARLCVCGFVSECVSKRAGVCAFIYILYLRASTLSASTHMHVSTDECGGGGGGGGSGGDGG